MGKGLVQQWSQGAPTHIGWFGYNSNLQTFKESIRLHGLNMERTPSPQEMFSNMGDSILRLLLERDFPRKREKGRNTRE